MKVFLGGTEWAEIKDWMKAQLTVSENGRFSFLLIISN